MNFILALDTTSKKVSIAISHREDVRFEYNFLPPEELSACLISSLELVLNSAGLRAEDIAAFGVCTGPGLFTGIRVGLSTLKGMLFKRNVPVVPVTSLEAMALKCMVPGVTVVPLVDARREEVYMAAYEGTETGMIEQAAPRLIRADQLPEHVGDKKRLSFIGSGVEVHKRLIADAFPTSRVVTRSAFLAAEICKLTYRRFSAGEASHDMGTVMPLYIRKPDAEQNYRPPEAKNK